MKQLGAYSLLRDLGLGPIGPRWRATHPETSEPVTLHILSEDDRVHPEGWSRLIESLPLLKDVEHPNLLSVVDVIEEAGVRAVVEEASDGPTLQSMLKAGQSLPAEQLVPIVADIAKALSHEMLGDMVHLRIHPCRIFIETDQGGKQVARLGDFALSRVIGATARPAHDSPMDAAYLAPEQWHPLLPVGPRTDVYALGVLMYRALTGALPFDGPSASAIGELHCTQSAPDPQDLVSQLPWQLDSAIRLAMTRHPADRLEDCGTLSLVLEAYLRDALVKPAPLPDKGPTTSAGSEAANMDTGVVHVEDLGGTPPRGHGRPNPGALDSTVDAEIPPSLRGVDLFGEEDRLRPADIGLASTAGAPVPQSLQGVDLSDPTAAPRQELGFAHTTDADVPVGLQGVDLSTPTADSKQELGLAHTTDADTPVGLQGVDLSEPQGARTSTPELAATVDAPIPQALWGVDLNPDAAAPAPKIPSGLENTTDPEIPTVLRAVNLESPDAAPKPTVDGLATTDDVSVPVTLQRVDLSPTPAAPSSLPHDLGTAETAGIDVGSAFQGVDLSMPGEVDVALGDTESHVTPRALLGLDLSVPEDEDKDED